MLAGCRVVDAPHPTVLYRTAPTQFSGSDGCLPYEIELCERLLADPRFAAHRSTIEATLQRFVAAHDTSSTDWATATRGRPKDARASFRRAIVDRSIAARRHATAPRGQHRAPCRGRARCFPSISQRAELDGCAASSSPTRHHRSREPLFENLLTQVVTSGPMALLAGAALGSAFAPGPTEPAHGR